MTATTATREFTPERKAQGFRDQAHLDAFYASVDHHAACTECGQHGSGTETTDGGWQPSETVCPEGRRLMNLY